MTTPSKRGRPQNRTKKATRKPNPVTVDRWTYRELGRKGSRFPAWVDRARGKSGVYIIRAKGIPAGEVLYIGESHTGKLYETMTRHVQRWQGDTAGPSYPRESVWIAFRTCPPGRAVAWQNALICEHDPRDNMLRPGCDDAAPF